MATFNLIDRFYEDLAHGKHNFKSDQLVVALSDSDSPPLTSDKVLSDITEISYTNLSSRNLSTDSSGTSASGVYQLTIADQTLSATGTVGPFRYIVLYNDTSDSDNLIGWFDYGSSVTMTTSQTFLIDFSAVTGVLSLKDSA